MTRHDAQRWQARHLAGGERDPGPPEPWLVRQASRLPRGPLLDAAAGRGRNALWLARRGHEVHALDIAPAAIEAIERRGGGEGLTIATRLADLDSPSALAGLPRMAGLVVIRYRPSRAQWQALARLLAPGGLVFLCSFGTAEGALGRINPAFCIDADAIGDALGPDFTLLDGTSFEEDGRQLEGQVWEKAAGR